MAQTDLEKKIKKADGFFNIKDYKNALLLYNQILKTNPNDPETNYAIGICYYQTDDKIKSIPYFETASKSNIVPPNVNLYLGKSLHLNKQYDKALAVLSKYKTTEKDPTRLEDVNHYIAFCNNAKRYDRGTAEIVVQNIGAPINTKFTEYGPVISADESVLIYTSVKPITVGKTQTFGKLGEYEDLIITKKDPNYGGWQPPVSININVPIINNMRSNVGSVGLSPDGQKLLVYVGGLPNTGDIYLSKLQGDVWGKLEKLGPEVNSPSQENSASLTPDEKIMFFASNRPGGFGGMDIYKVEKVGGAWGKAVNLGPTVNSKYDEDAPFIHPDGKTLYYSSNGPNSIGGMDVFKIIFEANKPSAPINMGAPINTVYNDGYFVLSADAKKGYFSSDRPGGLGGADIYFLGIPEEQGVVPLTMMKGKILAGSPPKPHPTKIKIIDKETKEIIKDVYQPNAKTGDYLVIFPPGKNYDIIIEAQGYKPALINIYVPNQNYFYELYQEIILAGVTKDGKMVGQSVAVKNVFEDVEKNNKDAKKDNAEVFGLMNGILSAEDSAALKDLLNVAYTDQMSVEKATAKEKAVKAEYFFSDPSGKLVPFVVGSDTLYTLAGLNTKEQTQKSAASKKQVLTKETVIKPNQIYIVYFDTDKTTLKTEAMPELSKVFDYLKSNQTFGVKIAGYTDADGTIERNQVLSDARAKAVSKYLVDKGIPKERMIAKGYGSMDLLNDNTNEDEKKLNRRVEVTMLELKKK